MEFVDLLKQNLYAWTPDATPPTTHTLDKGVCPSVARPATDAGFSNTKPSGGIRTKEESQAYMKLFFAAYFTFDDSQRTTALGISFKLSDLERAKWNQAFKKLKSHFQAIRPRTFGPRSFFSTLVKTSVMRHDFQVVCFNLKREAAILKQSASVTPEDMINCDLKVADIEASSNKHLSRLHETYKEGWLKG